MLNNKTVKIASTKKISLNKINIEKKYNIDNKKNIETKTKKFIEFNDKMQYKNIIQEKIINNIKTQRVFSIITIFNYHFLNVFSKVDNNKTKIKK